MGPRAPGPRRRRRLLVGSLGAALLSQVGLLVLGVSGTAGAQTALIDTQVTVGTSVNPSVFGQAVFLSATVASVDPLAGTPTGTVQFRVDGTNVGGRITVNPSGMAAISTTSLSVGSHAVEASYSGDAAFNASTGSLPDPQVVNRANSRILLSSSPNPSVAGQQVTLTATVRPVPPGSGSPQGGTVQFRVDGADFGAPVAVSVGQASRATTALAVGSHAVTAVFSGDASFNGSSGGPLTHVVNRAGSSASVASSSNPSVSGQSVTFTATVQPMAPSSGAPDGSVQFAIDGSTAGAPVALASGTATLTTSRLTVGPHAVTATYSGSASFTGSGGTLAGGQSVARAGSATALASSANPSLRLQDVTFTATVGAVSPGAGTPTGSVQFTIDGGVPVAIPLSNGQASFSSASFSAGDHTVAASYGGDGSFLASSGTLTQTVRRIDSSTSLTSSVDPSRPHQNVVFTATVSATSGGVPSGSVRFLIDGADAGTSALAGGQATLATTGLASGTHTVTAAYQGDATFDGSGDALVQTVVSPDTTTALRSSLNPSVSHQPVTFTAAVTAVDPDAGTPTGRVGFTIDGVDQGWSAMVGGQATLSTGTLGAGDHAVQARYLGDDTFAASSDTLTQTVLPATTTTHLAASHNPSAFGERVSFTATVTPSNPDAGTPGGRVSFSIDGVDRGSSAIVDGQAMLSVAGLAVGDHDVRASYPGDGTFEGSADGLTQSVARAATSTVLTSSDRPSVFGQTVTFTATVDVLAPGAGSPDGTVDFSVDGRDAGSDQLRGGAATLSTSDLSVGDHVVLAAYRGTGDFTASADSLTQTVHRADTWTSVSSSSNPSLLGSPVTFTAQVDVSAPGAGAPTGTVRFEVDGAPGPSVPLAGGTAGATMSNLSPGEHTVTAAYAGNGTFAPSSDALLQSVRYASGDCQGAPGRQVFPPITMGDPVSDFNAGSTVPAKFRVCDASGDPVGAPDVVESFELVRRVSDTGGIEVLHRDWTDGSFEYSNHAWKLNIQTKPLDGGYVYCWSVHLNDGTSVNFRFHLKGGSATGGVTGKNNPPGAKNH